MQEKNWELDVDENKREEIKFWSGQSWLDF